jgi:hypothetical protein
MVTDYDVWKDHAVTIEEILRVMGENEGKVKTLIKEIIPKIPKELDRKCECATALKGALIGGGD